MREAPLRPHEAMAEAEEARSWTCRTCDTMVEEDGAHCRACRAYWADVEAGVYDWDTCW